MNYLRRFVYEKVDQLEETRESILSDLKHAKKFYLSELLVANSFISELKALDKKEKNASCVPSGITPPTCNGDPLLFTTISDAFSPLIHKNFQVSKFYKISYLKSTSKELLQILWTVTLLQLKIMTLLLLQSRSASVVNKLLFTTGWSNFCTLVGHFKII